MSARTIEATVLNDGVETSYLRAGAGSPVVLLSTSGCDVALDPLFERLAREFRVFAPLLSCSEQAPSFSAWLRGLMDGLGLDQPRLVVSAANEQELCELLDRLCD